MLKNESWPQILTTLLDKDDLSVSQAEWAMSQIMGGEADPAQISGFLVALRAKGVTVGELVGFRDAILARALPVNLPALTLDIVGTGGDRIGTVNVSTMAAITAAAAGIPVVKHGNKAASSKSGSSDVLSALGINLELAGEQVEKVFGEAGITFIHAAKFGPGFKYAAPVRQSLGIPTVFNFLGPLCNPVRPEASAVGVADAAAAPLLAGVFQQRGAAALVFRGDDGLDELTTTGHSHIWEVSRGRIVEHDFDPREIGIARAEISALLGGTPADNAATVQRIFAGEEGPVRDIVLLNAAAGIVAFNLAKEPESMDVPLLTRLEAAIGSAADAIDSGAAAAKLEQWAKATAQV